MYTYISELKQIKIIVQKSEILSFKSWKFAGEKSGNFEINLKNVLGKKQEIPELQDEN